MRSAAFAAAMLLAGCQGGEPQQPATAAPSETAVPTASAAPAPTPSSTQQPWRHFQALGTEPFWSLEVRDGELRYSSPENPDGTTFAASLETVGAELRYTGTMDGRAVRLTIAPGTCSDGMSDTVYDWSAAFTLDGKTERGCARLK